MQSSLAPKGYLTGTVWDWLSVYTRYLDLIKTGKTLMNGGISHQVRGSLKEKYIKLAPYGAAVSAAVQKDADATIAKLISGELAVYKGAIANNTNEVKIPAGKAYLLTDPELNKMDWLAAGVLGSV